MNEDIKKMVKTARAMRKNGILSYKSTEIEISLSPGFLEAPETKTKIAEDTGPSALQNQFTDEQILMWSAPGYIADLQESN